MRPNPMQHWRLLPTIPRRCWSTATAFSEVTGSAGRETLSTFPTSRRPWRRDGRSRILRSSCVSLTRSSATSQRNAPVRRRPVVRLRAPDLACLRGPFNALEGALSLSTLSTT